MERLASALAHGAQTVLVAVIAGQATGTCHYYNQV